MAGFRGSRSLRWHFPAHDVDEFVATLRERPGFQHIVVTGRDAPAELIAIADLVSEVTKVKHPMDEGIRAQQGIEW